MSSSAPKSAPTASASEVLNFLAQSARCGGRGVLATITGLTGSSARDVGTQMAVIEDGRSAGSVSSGCVEQAIAAEALSVLSEGAARTVRFGAGSPYIDIRLPCGGGMDMLFQPDPPVEVLQTALDALRGRRPITLALDPCGSLSLSDKPLATGWHAGVFAVRRRPPLRLILLGHGAEVLAVMRLAREFGADVEVYSPDEQVTAAADAQGLTTHHLSTPASLLSFEGDPWTAFLFLFHDHDWEAPLLARALAADAIWVGAMGSAATHRVRCRELTALGVRPRDIARVRGPVGLIASVRDPKTLALSALAEIVGAYQTVDA